MLLEFNLNYRRKNIHNSFKTFFRNSRKKKMRREKKGKKGFQKTSQENENQHKLLWIQGNKRQKGTIF